MRVTTYEELNKYVSYYLDSDSPIMIVQSRGGLGKTELIKEKLRTAQQEFVYKSGFMTVTELVRLFYDNKDALIVIDDVDMLFNNQKTFSILRSACDTGSDRRVEYASPSYTVSDIPKSFSVNSRVLLLVNDFPDSTTIQAFKTRALCIDFTPSPEEVTNYLRTIISFNKNIVHDDEVLDFFSTLAPVSRTPNLRAYVLSAKLKPSGIDWRKHLVESVGVDPLIGAMLQSGLTTQSYKDRVKIFTGLTGRSPRTYDRLLRDHRSLVQHGR